MNYSIEFDKIVNSLTERKKLLLHSCCGPCSSYVITQLLDHFDVTILYYNPNIYPYEEYLKRKNEQIRLIEIINLMQKYNIEPKEIKFIYKNAESDSKLIIIHGQKNGKPGLKISNPLFIYNMDGTYSVEYNNLINEVIK